MIVAEPQAYSVPPQLRASSNELTPLTSSAAPAQSILCSRRCTGSRRSTNAHRTIATTPSGRLMKKIQRHSCSAK
jgi:hypothetical protein